MNKQSIHRIIAAIERQKKRIAKERDALRDLLSELADICEGCDEAVVNLDYAADAMSRLL